MDLNALREIAGVCLGLPILMFAAIIIGGAVLFLVERRLLK